MKGSLAEEDLTKTQVSRLWCLQFGVERPGDFFSNSPGKRGGKGKSCEVVSRYVRSGPS